MRSTWLDPAAFPLASLTSQSPSQKSKAWCADVSQLGLDCAKAVEARAVEASTIHTTAIVERITGLPRDGPRADWLAQPVAIKRKEFLLSSDRKKPKPHSCSQNRGSGWGKPRSTKILSALCVLCGSRF